MLIFFCAFMQQEDGEEHGETFLLLIKACSCWGRDVLQKRSVPGNTTAM